MDKATGETQRQDEKIVNYNEEIAEIKSELSNLITESEKEIEKWRQYRETHTASAEKQIASLWIRIYLHEEGIMQLGVNMIESYWDLITEKVPSLVLHIVSEHTGDVVREQAKISAQEWARVEAVKVAREWLDKFKHRGNGSVGNNNANS